MIRRRFSMSGGSVGLFEGKKIGRKKNLEVLETDIKKLESTEGQLNIQSSTVRTHLQALKNADESATLQREREALNRIRQERAGTRAKFDNIAAFVANFDAQAGDANQRIESLTASNASIEKLLLEKNAQADALRERLSNADGSFRDVAEQLSQASAAFNQNNIGFIQQQNRVNTLRQELSFREKRREELRQTLSSAQNTLARHTDEIGLLEADIAEQTRQ